MENRINSFIENLNADKRRMRIQWFIYDRKLLYVSLIMRRCIATKQKGWNDESETTLTE